jgi:Uma2 family endonuclease
MSTAPATVCPQPSPLVLPFQSGDMMDQPTFHELYKQAPENVRAELIGGIVYIKEGEGVASPLSLRHGRIHLRVAGWLHDYQIATPGVQAADNATAILGPENEVQPDVFLFIEGGRAHENEGGYLAGPPDFVAEVAHASASIDTHKKKFDYERYGVGEYLVLLAKTSQALWFVRGPQGFVQHAPGADGILRSPTLPGLWLDAEALFRGDSRRVQEVLQQGLATSEHAAFVQRLKTS